MYYTATPATPAAPSEAYETGTSLLYEAKEAFGLKRVCFPTRLVLNFTPLSSEAQAEATPLFSSQP